MTRGWRERKKKLEDEPEGMLGTGMARRAAEALKKAQREREKALKEALKGLN
jgi:hypothetical protein